MITAKEARDLSTPSEIQIRSFLTSLETRIKTSAQEGETSTHVGIPHNILLHVRPTLERHGYTVNNITKDSYCISWK